MNFELYLQNFSYLNSFFIEEGKNERKTSVHKHTLQDKTVGEEVLQKDG